MIRYRDEGNERFVKELFAVRPDISKGVVLYLPTNQALRIMMALLPVKSDLLREYIASAKHTSNLDGLPVGPVGSFVR